MHIGGEGQEMCYHASGPRPGHVLARMRAEGDALHPRRNLDLSTLPALTPRQVSALVDEQLRRRKVPDAAAAAGCSPIMPECTTSFAPPAYHAFLVDHALRCTVSSPKDMVRRVQHEHSLRWPRQHSCQRAGPSSSSSASTEIVYCADIGSAPIVSVGCLRVGGFVNTLWLGARA